MVNDNNMALQGLHGNKPTRLGWFFRKLVRVALDVVEATVPYIGSAVVNAIEENTNVNEWIDQAGRTTLQIPEYEPTSAEQVVLENWVHNVFNPFFKSLTSDLAAAFNDTSVTVQLAGINRALARMCVVSGHYARADRAGLSDQAVKFRVDLIAELLDPVVDLIEQALDATALEFVIAEARTNVTASDYPNMNIPAGAHTCMQYAIKSGTPAAEIQTAVIPKPTVVTTTDPKATLTTDTPRRGRIFLGIAAILLIGYGLSGNDEKNNN